MSGKKPPRPLTGSSRPVVPRPARGRPVVPVARNQPTDQPTDQPLPAPPEDPESDHPEPDDAGPDEATPDDATPDQPGPDEATPVARPAAPVVPHQRAVALRLPVGPPPQAPSRRGRVVIIAVVAALVLAAAGLAVLVSRGDDPAATDARDPEAATPAAPVDLAPRSALVHARVTAAGDVVVRQWIRSASTLFGIGLSPPPGAGVASADSPVRVRDVQVFAKDGPAPGPKSVTEGREYYPFGAGSKDVFVSYRLKNAVERSGSVAGRALATVTALDADVTPRLVATTYAVSGGDVLALACATGEPDAVPVPCGEPAGDGWRVERSGDHRGDVVTAQVDLP